MFLYVPNIIFGQHLHVASRRFLHFGCFLQSWLFLHVDLGGRSNMGTVVTWHLPFSHLEHFHNMDCMIRCYNLQMASNRLLHLANFLHSWSILHDGGFNRRGTVTISHLPFLHLINHDSQGFWMRTQYLHVASNKSWHFLYFLQSWFFLHISIEPFLLAATVFGKWLIFWACKDPPWLPPGFIGSLPKFGFPWLDWTLPKRVTLSHSPWRHLVN